MRKLIEEMESRRAITVGQLQAALEGVDPDTPLIYAADDEGNAYHPVLYLGAVGNADDYTEDMINSEVRSLGDSGKVFVLN